MQVYKALVVKLDPTPKQAEQFASHIGGARFCYNKLLSYAQEQYKAGNKIDLSGYSLRKLWNENKNEWAPWWEQNSKETYSNAALNLGRAFKDFFKKTKGHPKFKKKSLSNSYTITSGSFGITDPKHLKIPRIGKVHVLEPLDVMETSSIVIREKADGYYATLIYKTGIEPKRATGKTVGVDLGVSSLVTLSTGEKIAYPKKLSKLDRKCRKLARNVSKKKKGSANREKAKTKLARVQQKLQTFAGTLYTNSRPNWLANLTLSVLRI